MFCTQCGKQNPDGTKFCVECGAQLVTAEPEVTPVEPVVEAPVEAPVVEAPVVEAPAAAPVYENVEYVAPAPQELPCKALGIVSMILGIVAISLVVTFCCCYLSYGTLPFMLGLAAVITGAIAKSKAKAVGMKNGKATVGFICGLIAVILIAVVGIIAIVAYILGMSSIMMEPSFDSYYYDDYYYYFINNFMM